MTFVGFIVNYMLRINLNITIVDMIVIREAPASTPLPALASNLTNTTLAFNTTNLAPLASAVSIRNISVRPERYSWERQFLDWANVSEYQFKCGVSTLLGRLYSLELKKVYARTLNDVFTLVISAKIDYKDTLTYYCFRFKIYRTINTCLSVCVFESLHPLRIFY